VADSKKTKRAPRERKRLAGRLKDLVTNWPLYILLVPGLLFVLIFSYGPMVGIVIAFEDFNPIQGLFGSPFVGFQNFQIFFEGQQWLQVTFNTFFLNALFIASGTVASLFIAILLTELGKSVLVRVVQTVVILPNFISWPIIAMIALVFLQSPQGVVDELMTRFHLPPTQFYSDPNVWPVTLMILNTWKGAGFGAIIYMASIMGIDKEMYEAARIDGATRMQMIFRITLPMLRPMIAILLLLSVGGMFKGNTDMIYSMVGNNSLLYSTTNVIDTYVFRNVLNGIGFGINGAVGLMQSLLGFALVLLMNWLAKKIDPDYALF